MKPFNNLHKWMDRDGLETAVLALRTLADRAEEASVQDPSLVSYAKNLEAALMYAERAFTKFQPSSSGGHHEY
jgi:hypothetical protein